ncbi:Putative ribonuclease H protein At1g65750 [Linum grandiflorum]
MDFLSTLSVDILLEGPASLRWPLEKSDRFSVNSLAKQRILSRFPGVADFPHDVVWHPLVPLKVACFMWQVWHGKILTIDNLMRRGFFLPNHCVLCEKACETIFHLFWDCSYTQQVWIFFSSRLSLFGPFPGSVSGLCSGWKGLNWGWGLRFKGCLDSLLHCMLWSLWTERNNRCFRDKHKSARSVALRAAATVGH